MKLVDRSYCFIEWSSLHLLADAPPSTLVQSLGLRLYSRWQTRSRSKMSGSFNDLRELLWNSSPTSTRTHAALSKHIFITPIDSPAPWKTMSGFGSKGWLGINQSYWPSLTPIQTTTSAYHVWSRGLLISLILLMSLISFSWKSFIRLILFLDAFKRLWGTQLAYR